jgi:hypothetical protein
MSEDKVTPGEGGQGGTFSTEQAVALRGETAALAQAERLKAGVQARYLVAMKQPRDWDQVRVRLMKECRRPGFSEGGLYLKPVGNKMTPIGRGVMGLSVRFAEAAVRCMTNLLAESEIVFEDDERRQIRVTVTDLEGNVSYPIDVMVAKTVERSKLPDGETALRVRINSQGKPTYLLPATEDDMLNKTNSAVSKAIRTAALRILPGDIADECEALMIETRLKQDTADPDAAKKKLLDAFATLNVMPSEIKQYIGHPVEQLSPQEIQELRALYTAIKDGEATWSVALESKKPIDVKAEVVGKDKRSALDKLAGVAPSSSNAPECAGCAKNTPTPDVTDDEGRAWHKLCLDAVKKDQSRKG